MVADTTRTHPSPHRNTQHHTGELTTVKLDAPINNNYAATVVQLTAINPFPNSDNIVGTPIHGFQAVIGKDSQVGDIGIVFPAEVALSEKYAWNNNLHRHGDLNKDPEAKGYLEDSRRVKAIKLRGNRSDCLFMPLSSLAWTGINPDDLNVGDTFDHLNGHEICRKHLVREPKTSTGQTKVAKWTRVDGRHLPEHISTDNYFRNADNIPENADIIVTAKLHGTSVRIANTIVARKLTWKDRLAAKLGVPVQATGFDYIYGSRRVIKDANDPNQKGFYEKDLWTAEGSKLVGRIPEGWILFGELIGWADSGAKIQKGYSYRLPQGTAELYIYRIAVVNQQGRLADLSWDAVQEFCTEIGVKAVPELWRGKHRDFDPQVYMDRSFHDTGLTQTPPLEDGKKIVDEGVCVRVDSGLVPQIYKAKAPMFLQHETKLLDEGVEDLESVEAA